MLFEKPDDFLKATRILVCLLPLTPETENILNRETLGRLLPGGYVVNVNNSGHQETMPYLEKETFYFRAYDLLGQTPYKRVLVLGAGTGSDVAIALHNGAEHVDAVEIDPRKAELVELCAFLGCSRIEAADILGVSEATVKRDLRVARAWLASRLGLDAGSAPM